MNEPIKCKTVVDLENAIHNAIGILGPNALWAPDNEETIVISKSWPTSDPTDIYIQCDPV